jgi:hypothetical protein
VFHPAGTSYDAYLLPGKVAGSGEAFRGRRTRGGNYLPSSSSPSYSSAPKDPDLDVVSSLRTLVASQVVLLSALLFLHARCLSLLA